ncbi:hypothetical protein Cni_G13206 [Canna indica]|uniref:Dirigent protein n=1 Tax=Canna indica TaxID=4628 RepID=A0AAQ3QDI0_9LILI|nr:hypothetical protein Cni_G13206 [Canna indica]
MMDKAGQNGLIKGVRMSDELVVAHLEFADDFVVFTSGDRNDLLNLKLLLVAYELASGLKANLAKTKVVHVRGCEERGVEAAAILGCKRGTFPLKYLGLPLRDGRLAREDWNCIIEKCSFARDGWRRLLEKAEFSLEENQMLVEKDERIRSLVTQSKSSSFLIFFLLFSACEVIARASVHHVGDEKLTHLHFYFHEIDAGPNSTVVMSVDLHKNGTTFGNIGIFDNTLRTGPEPSSALIGRAQGIGVHSALDDKTGLTTINLVFTAGEYKDSSLALLGLFKVTGESDRSIVGGSGRFRLARGYALSKLVNSTTTTLVVEFDVYVKHY